MRKTINFLAGAFCGALVGGVAALLYTPYAGNELQRRVRAKTQELIEKGQMAAVAKQAELEAQFEAFKQGQAVVLQETPPPGERP